MCGGAEKSAPLFYGWTKTLQFAAPKMHGRIWPARKHLDRRGVHRRMNFLILARAANARNATWVFLGASVAVFLGGCGRRPIIVQAPPATVIQSPAPAPVVAAPVAQPPVVVLKEAPPPPRPEAMTPQPASDYVWVPGYWMWRAGQQEWVAGHWEVPPRPGARWVSARWEKQGDGYIFMQGYWQ